MITAGSGGSDLIFQRVTFYWWEEKACFDRELLPRVRAIKDCKGLQIFGIGIRGHAQMGHDAAQTYSKGTE